MKKIAVLTLLAILAAPLPCARAAEDVGSAIVAIVNKDVITNKQVMDRAEALLKAIGSDVTGEKREELRRTILKSTIERLIEDRLLVAEAQRLVDAYPNMGKRLEEEVEQRMQQERRNKGGELEFQDTVKAMGLTVPEYAKKVREDILRNEVLMHFVMRDLTVSPAELQEYYRTHPDECRAPAQVKYRQVFLRFGDYESRDKAAEQAQFVMDQLNKGFDFAELAKKYSGDSHAADGGLCDFEPLGMRLEPVDKLLRALEIGKIGGPVETEIGFTILKVEAREPGAQRPFEQVQPLIETKLLAQKRSERYDALIERLKKENYVEVMQ